MEGIFPPCCLAGHGGKGVGGVIHGQELTATVPDPDCTPLFSGSWTDLDPFLESWNGSGMDLFIQEKNQFSSSLKEQTSPL